VASGKVRGSFKGGGGFVRAVAFLPGDLLAAGGYDGAVRIWDMRVRGQRATLKGHKACVNCLAGAARLLASGGDDRMVRLWDTATRKQLMAIEYDLPVWSVAFSPDGKVLATGDAKGTIHLWSVPRLLSQNSKKGAGRHDPQPEEKARRLAFGEKSGRGRQDCRSGREPG
jgi:WD40 repeat protein